MRDSSVLDIFQMICICEQDSDRSAFLHILLKDRKGKLFISHTVVESGKGIVDIKLRKLFVFLSKDQFSIERFYRCTEGVERLKKETDDPAGNRSFPEQDTQSHIHGNEPVKRNTHFVSQKLQYVEAGEPFERSSSSESMVLRDIRQPVGQDVIGNVLSMISRIDRNARQLFEV